MRNHRSLSVFTTSLGIALAIAISGCAVADKPQSIYPHVDDATITTQVKARFLDSPRVDGRVIHVSTLQGTVLLTGTAASQVEKTQASEIALGVNGVKVVQNEITVAP